MYINFAGDTKLLPQDLFQDDFTSLLKTSNADSYDLFTFAFENCEDRLDYAVKHVIRHCTFDNQFDFDHPMT